MSTTPGLTVADKTLNFVVFDHSTQLTPSRHGSGFSTTPISSVLSKALALRQQAYSLSQGRSLLLDLSESAPSITVVWSPRLIYRTGKRIDAWLRSSITLTYKCTYVHTSTSLVSDTRGLVRGQLAYLY